MEDFFEDRPKLNVWDKIYLWWRYDGKYYYKFLREGIRNIIYWFPIIWKDRNWDSSYIFTMLQHKLKAQAKYIGTKNRLTNSQLNARRMTICVNLIQKIQDDYYAIEYMDYAKNKHWFEPCEDRPGYSTWESQEVWEKYDDYFAKYPLIYKKAMKGEGVFSLEGREDDKQVIAMNIAHINEARAHDLLFKILKNDINSWWD
jgi:hypothetical protein